MYNSYHLCTRTNNPKKMNTLELREKSVRRELNLPVKVAVAKGDGIGPEIMEATLRILEAAGANIEPEFIELGEKVYLSGNTSGVGSGAWETISGSKIILKAPITTPRGKGYKSLNVTLRKSLGLFANVRPVASLDPFVPTHFPEMDVVIIRENEEDLYAGIEHRQTQDVYQCLKLITRPGCERIVRYAFEYARAYGRKKVTCMVKDNIMKITDGLFHKVFDEIAPEYPEIASETQILGPVGRNKKGIKGMIEPTTAASPTINAERRASLRLVGVSWCSSAIITPTQTSSFAVIFSTI